MIKNIAIILALFIPLVSHAQEYSIVRSNSNVWVNECKSCHSDYKELAKQTGIHTEQYYFNLVFKHKNKDGKEFGTILSKSEISFVSRFVLIAAYLHKLETDMRKAGDHLIKKL